MPGYRLPGRVKDQIASVTEKLYAVATWFKHVHKVGLADTVFAWSRLNLDAIFNQDVGNIREMLRIAIPVADMVETSLRAGSVAHHGYLMHQWTHTEPGPCLCTII